MKTLKELQGLDADKVAKAIEDDAGQTIPGLCESLSEAKAGKFTLKHTPSQVPGRKLA